MYAAAKAAGKGIEAAGEARGDEDLQTNGQADRSKVGLKDAGGKVKVAFKK